MTKLWAVFLGLLLFNVAFTDAQADPVNTSDGGNGDGGAGDGGAGAGGGSGSGGGGAGSGSGKCKYFLVSISVKRYEFWLLIRFLCEQGLWRSLVHITHLQSTGSS